MTISKKKVPKKAGRLPQLVSTTDNSNSTVFSKPEPPPDMSDVDWTPHPYTFRTSDTITKLLGALGNLQSKVRFITKDSVGSTGRYDYSYASLGACIEEIQPHLTAENLVITQYPINHGTRVGVLTHLAHTSGEWILSGFTFDIGMGGNPVQRGGAAISYARRYALCAILGLVAEEDMDAQD